MARIPDCVLCCYNENMIQLTERKVRHVKRIADYKKFNPKQVAQILREAEKLRGKKILHINATAEGGGVAELLESQVALERSLGLNSKWFVLNAPGPFFKVTKKIHNLVQGESGFLSPREQATYLNTTARLEKSFKHITEQEQPDVIIIHDPQPLPLVKAHRHQSQMILRIHTDLSKPNPKIIKFLAPFINLYPQVVVSSDDFVPALPKPAQKNAVVIMPAIDPLSVKNTPMKPVAADRAITQLGLNPNHPIISQVSRFDPWKDPVGVVEAYFRARRSIPELQLVLAGIMSAKDDPQAAEIFKQVQKKVQRDPQVLLISDSGQLGSLSVNAMVNAVFTASDVVLQKSLKEGFGLTITEAMWKGKPVIGGNAHGVKLQITNNVNGLIVKNVNEAARAIVTLLTDRKLANRLGQRAVASVQKQFLLPRYLLQNLKTYTRIRQ